MAREISVNFESLIFFVVEEYSIICPRRYALRVSQRVDCEISGEVLVSIKKLICEEM